uniref:Perilipin-5-like n=1 Tax=Pundamilia nyererei TaxID=303518 RepID=A0A3B4GIK0_9CICH
LLKIKNSNKQIKKKASHLPLVRSALQMVTSMYSGVKARNRLLGLMGGMAEVGVRSFSQEAMRRATPLLQSLEPQIDAANSFALVGLDHLEKTYPILNQSTDEVMTHLKDAFFLTLDDVQLWVVDGLDAALDQLERLADVGRVAVQQLQNTQVGQAAMSGLDDVLSRVEDATAYYLPLPPTLRQEWELRVQQYESDDDGDEPSMWTRVRSLLLTLSLQLYHRLMKIREQLQRAVRAMGDAADKVGLLRVLKLSGDLLQFLQGLLVALVYQAEALREASLNAVRVRATMLAELRVVRLVRGVPLQIQELLQELREVAKIILQFVFNTTPLYNMVKELVSDNSSRRGSSNSLFLKAMDGRPRRRRSLYSRAARGSGGPVSPDPTNGCRRSSLKEPQAAEVEGTPLPSEGAALRRPSAAELLLAPLKQFVSQSQKAFEYLTPNSSENAANATETTDS